MLHVMRGSSRLTPAQREMIATVISLAAHCRYCTVTHAGALRRVGGDNLTAEFIQNDWRKADLTDTERAMLEYAGKMTLTPATCMSRNSHALPECR